MPKLRVRFIGSNNRKNWKGLTSPEQTHQAIQLLEQHGYLKKIKESGVGGSSEVIFINPLFMQTLNKEGGVQ